MKTSIVIPTQNSYNQLKELLNALAVQTILPDEIIVVDDISDDETIALANNYGCKVIQRKCNIPEARNEGVKLAKSDIIVFIDSDCFPEYNWLSELIAPIKKGEVCSVGKIIANKQNLVSMAFDYNLEKATSNEDYVQTASTENMAIKKHVIQEVGYFDEKIKYGEDLDLCLKLKAKGYKIFRNPKAVVIHMQDLEYKKAMKKWAKYATVYPILRKRYPGTFTRAIVTRVLFTGITIVSFINPLLWLAVISPFFFYLQNLIGERFSYKEKIQISLIAWTKFMLHSWVVTFSLIGFGKYIERWVSK